MKRAILIALALAGVAICALLSVMSAPDGGEAVAANWCAPTQRLNCGHVLGSAYARVGPISVAPLGLAYFAMLAAWFGIVGLPNWAGRAWQRLPLGLTAIGATASAYFVYIMAFKLPVWCPWCVAVHVVNALILVLLLIWRPTAPPANATAVEKPHPSPIRAWGVIGGAGALGLIIFLAGFAAFQFLAARSNQLRLLKIVTDVDYCVWNWKRQPLMELPIRPDESLEGPADAPYTAVAFIDFECTHCRDLYLFSRQIQTAFPDRVRFAFKHYPMNNACNLHQKNVHQFACDAALAAEAARIAGTAEQCAAYRKLLFANMSRLAEQPFAALAAQAGIDRTAFDRALANRAGADRIADDVEVANRVGVTGSGKIFLQGRELEYWTIAAMSSGKAYDIAKTRQLWEALLDTPAKLPSSQPDK